MTALSVSMNWLFQVLYISGIIQYLSFCVWLISLSITSSRFLHVAVCVRTSCLGLNNISSYGCTTSWLSIHPLMDTWAASTFWVLEISLLWTHIVNEHLFETLLSIIFSIHPEAELMEHIIILFLIFLRTAIWFTTAAAPYSIPTSSAWGIRISPHHHQCLLLSVF